MQDQLFFRTRKNGTAVFRVREDEVNHRLEMIQIAVVKPDGDVKPHQKQNITEAEHAQIAAWCEARAKGDATHLDAYCDQINLAAQYIQADASDSEIAAAQNRLLLSIHDLRSSLVRRLGRTKD